MGLYELSYNLRMFKIENLPEMGYSKRVQQVNVKKATFQRKRVPSNERTRASIRNIPNECVDKMD